MLYSETLIRVDVKINPKARVLNMNCCYVTVVDCLKVALVKFNTTVAVNFSNSTSISTLPCTDRKLTKKFFITHKRQLVTVTGNIQLYCL